MAKRLQMTGEFPVGPKGDAGLSAYEIARKNGFEGTEAEWLESLEGNSGVYIGSGEMPEGYNVQIDPDGDAFSLPVKGVDYFTEDDKAEIVAEAVSEVQANTSVPEGVLTAASAMVNKAMSREDNRILRFLISADAHQKNDDALIAKGNKELGQAHGEVLKLIGVDFVANLGDITWASSESDNATVLEEAKTFNRFMLDKIRGQTQIWTEGNHETDKLTASQIHSLIYSHNKALVQDVDHWIDGYGYMDFPYQKVRVICLNTDQSTGNDTSGVSDTQLKWFAETALNMEGKTDWSIITMGHHPLDFNNITMMKNCMWVLEAFLNGTTIDFTTNGGTQIAVDYSDKCCQYVAHFHGHTHAFSVVKLQKWVASETYEELDAWEICIPNACYTRNNQNLNNGQYTARYSTETTYNKTDEDGNRTSFNLVTVCLDEKKIYADNYGAGIDRELNYWFEKASYTNLLDDAGYVTDTYLSSGNEGSRTGMECTGFIPFDGTSNYIVYLSGISSTGTNGMRFAMYDASKGFLVQVTTSNFASNSYAPVTVETDANGDIVKLNFNEFVAAYGKTPSYFRLCSDNIDSSSIITVNQAID